MADMVITGRVGNAHVRQWNTFTANDGGTVQGRDGLDVYLIGSKLDDVPTVVRVDYPTDKKVVNEAGQFALVQITATQPRKNGPLEAVAGGVSVMEGNTSGES